MDDELAERLVVATERIAESLESIDHRLHAEGEDLDAHVGGVWMRLESIYQELIPYFNSMRAR